LWYSIPFPQVDLAHFIVQGLLINSYIIYSYIDIFRRLKAYHLLLIESYATLLTQEERATLIKTNGEVRTFFIFICQMLVVQSLFLCSIWIR